MNLRLVVDFIARAALGLVFAACASPAGNDEPKGHTANAVSINNEKVEGQFFLTTFGGPNDSGDNGQLACGGRSNPGSNDVHEKYYAAAKQRFGCGTHIKLEANGKCIILETTDAGPAAWVEDKAGGPVIDATPLAAQELFGGSGFGWSDKKAVQLSIADASTPLGPCGGGSTDNGSSSPMQTSEPSSDTGASSSKQTSGPSTDTGDDDMMTFPPPTTGDGRVPPFLCQFDPSCSP
jgi:hypothetical protein